MAEDLGSGYAQFVVRGGSWNNNARNCRSAYRNNNQPDNRNNNVGVRVVVFSASTLQSPELPQGIAVSVRERVQQRVPATWATVSENQTGRPVW